MEPVSPPELPWHVLAQQALLSVIEAKQGLLWGDWFRSLVDSFPELPADGFEPLLGHLCATDWVSGSHSTPLSPGPRLEEIFGRSHYRDLMATFSGGDLLTARHGIADVGLLDPSLFSDQEDGLPKILLAGRVWQATSVDWKKRIAQLEPAEGGGKAQWMGTGPGMSAALADAIRRLLMDGQVGAATLSKRAAAALAELADEIPAGEQPQTEECAPGRFKLWTFSGSRENRRQAAADARFGAGKSDGLSIDYRADPRKIERLSQTPELLDLPPAVCKRMGEGIKFHEVLPETLLSEIVSARF